MIYESPRFYVEIIVQGYMASNEEELDSQSKYPPQYLDRLIS